LTNPGRARGSEEPEVPVSVSVAPERGRKATAELNLVPFIDLLSVCITFLIATAVWVDLSSLQVDHEVGGGAGAVGPEPLRVHLAADGVRVGRAEEALVPRRGGEVDWEEVDARMAADRAEWPAERQIVLLTDDGLPYREMIRALDLATAHGYDRRVLGGGPGR
jgi:biopolymer transport protein ExbD